MLPTGFGPKIWKITVDVVRFRRENIIARYRRYVVTATANKRPKVRSLTSRECSKTCTPTSTRRRFVRFEGDNQKVYGEYYFSNTLWSYTYARVIVYPPRMPIRFRPDKSGEYAAEKRRFVFAKIRVLRPRECIYINGQCFSGYYGGPIVHDDCRLSERKKTGAFTPSQESRFHRTSRLGECRTSSKYILRTFERRVILSNKKYERAIPRA